MNTQYSQPALRVSEGTAVLYNRFLEGVKAPQIEGLTEEQCEHVARAVYALSFRGHSRSALQEAEVNLSAMFRFANKEGVDEQTARHTIFGPAPSERYGAVFYKVRFYAVMTHAVRALDPSQRDERDHSKLVVPKHWHQWYCEFARLSRISIMRPEDLILWADVVTIMGGDPRVIAFTCVDPEHTDVLPDGKQSLFEIPIRSPRHLIEVTSSEMIPPGLESFFGSVQMLDSGESLTRAEEALTLASYKSV